MKRPTSLILVAALIIALLPERRAQAQTTNQPPDSLLPVVCGLVVLGVGAIVVFKLVQLCKKINNSDSPKDGSTNAPAPGAEFILPSDSTVTGPVTLAMDDSSVSYWDCSSNGWLDPVSGGPVTAMLQGRLQSSADLKLWQDECTAVGWCSPSGTTLVFYRNGSAIATNYIRIGSSSAVRILPDSVSWPAKFYRWTSP